MVTNGSIEVNSSEDEIDVNTTGVCFPDSDVIHYEDRVIVHIDQDCFYCQVESNRDKSLEGRPFAVVQYNVTGDLQDMRPEDYRIVDNKQASIIALSYEAKAAGVTRTMKVKDALVICPDAIFVQVPVNHGKADLNIYRDEGAKIVEILSEWGTCERASVDEAYVDLTHAASVLLQEIENSEVESEVDKDRNPDIVGSKTKWKDCLDEAGISKVKTNGNCDDYILLKDVGVNRWNKQELRLICGAAIVSRIRKAVMERLNYRCSGGIAPNKLLSKLGSGLHKPNQQTLILPHSIPSLLRNLPFGKLKSLGGKVGGQIMSDLNLKTVGDIWLHENLSPKLAELYGVAKGKSIYQLCHGLHNEPVQSSGKTFRHRKLECFDDINIWLKQLSTELMERINQDMDNHQRMPRTFNIAFMHGAGRARKRNDDEHVTRTFTVTRQGLNVGNLASICLKKIEEWYDSERAYPVSITSMNFTASNFITNNKEPPISFKRLLNSTKTSLENEHKMKRSAEIVDEFATDGHIDDRLSSRPKYLSCKQEGEDDSVEIIDNDLRSKYQSGMKPVPQQTYTVDPNEIDESILSELPLSLRQEILEGMRQAKKMKRESTSEGSIGKFSKSVTTTNSYMKPLSNKAVKGTQKISSFFKKKEDTLKEDDKHGTNRKFPAVGFLGHARIEHFMAPKKK